MIAPSLAANLIKNMVQATVYLGDAWEDVEEPVREQIVSDWIGVMEAEEKDKKEIAHAVVARLTTEKCLNEAWLKIDPEIREQQVGLIAEVVGNLGR